MKQIDMFGGSEQKDEPPYDTPAYILNPPPAYPDGPGFQKGSDTSQAAAEKVAVTSKAQEAMAFDWIKSRGDHGATIDELSIYLTNTLGQSKPPGTASARMRALEMRTTGPRIMKTDRRRMTRTNSPAKVYIATDI